jgi:hypothetical protein
VLFLLLVHHRPGRGRSPHRRAGTGHARRDSGRARQSSRRRARSAPEHPDLSIDQQVALRTAASKLGREFADIYGPETIERFLASSYDQFATTSTIPNFLPLLAERFARQRLDALARVEGHHRDGKPVVLLLCTHNAGRSQMALGFFTKLTSDRARWPGPAAPNLATRSTRRRSPSWPNAASTSPASTRSRGLMGSSAPPTW